MLTLTNAATNIVFDGNSLFANSVPMVSGGVSSNANRIGEQFMALAPISGAMTYQNLATGGATFKTMVSGETNGTSGISEVHAAFQTGKQNLLFILEARNTSATPRANGAACTASDIVADCKAYIDAVKAVHPEWRVYITIAFAFQRNSTADDDANAAIDGFNDYVRTNYSDIGAEGFVETRPPGGPLAYSPPYVYSETTFTKSGYYLDATHLYGNGNAIVAQYFADKLSSIPATAPVVVPSVRFVRSGGKMLIAGGKLISTLR